MTGITGRFEHYQYQHVKRSVKFDKRAVTRKSNPADGALKVQLVQGLRKLVGN